MADYMGQKIKDQEINLLNNENLAHKLSHGMIMENCVINFKVPAKAIIITKAKFINCTLNFKTKLTNYPFTSSYFENCIFLGKLSGCEFGYRPSIHLEEEEKFKGNIINCDFSKMALFDKIRLMNCDINKQILPTFPNFVIIDPIKNYRNLVDEDFPHMLKINFNYEDYLDDNDKGLVFDAEIMSKEYDIPIDKLKSIFSKYDFIKM